MAIVLFRNDYRWLSNFVLANVKYEGITYPSVEHAYQAAKTTDVDTRECIAIAPTAGIAKKMGSSVVLRPDWDNVKLDIMKDLVTQKFNDDKYKELLLNTNKHKLIEGNSWGDTFWGECDGIGQNHLGKILMKVRADLAKQHKIELQDVNDILCKTCGAYMIERSGKFGKFLGCSAYPKCKYTERI